MESYNFLGQLENIEHAKSTIVNVLESYFFTGNFEHQVGLVSNAIQEIVSKGAEDSDKSLDNQFGYTNRYIRESIYDLTELQKFLIRLHIVYDDYKKQLDLLEESK